MRGLKYFVRLLEVETLYFELAIVVEGIRLY